MYDVDFNDTANKNTLIHLRGNVFIVWFKVLLKPLKTINNLFLELIETTDYRLSITGQVIYLEHYLNDLYDPVNREIFIEDIANIQFNYIFQDIEQRPPVYVYQASELQPPFYLFHQSEYDQAINFIIHIPVAVSFNEIVLRSQVDVYKQAGKQYSIETF